MKTIILILISTLTISGLQAQSKKKVNQQLLIELAAVTNTSDSLEEIRGNKEREMKYLSDHLASLNKRIRNQKNTEDKSRSEIIRFHTDLVQMGFNADSIFSLNDLNVLISPIQKENILEMDIPVFQPIDFTLVSALQDLTDVKIKVQNEMLEHKIAEFDKANELNKKVLVNQQSQIDELRAIRTKVEVFVEGYDAFNRQLSGKSNDLKRKYFEVAEKKAEAERVKREKELAAASKSKGKKPKVVEITDDPFDNPFMEERRGYIEKDSQDGFIAVPPPPPPVKEPPVPEILETVEQPAEFPGGQQAMKTYLSANLKYPVAAIEAGIQGKCYIKFVVSETGNISNVIVAKGVPDCPSCDAEAVRVVKSMPKWKPAMNSGKPVNSWYTLPVSFKIVTGKQ
jgi:TonB family protein